MASGVTAKSFLDAFWGAEGFAVVEERLNKNLKSTELICYYIKERASIEDAYAQRLDRLLRVTENDVTEIGTSRNAWFSVRGETENLANHHREFAKMLSKELLEPMIKFKDDQRKIRRQYLGDAFKVNKQLNKMTKYVDDIKEKYYKLSKEAEEEERKVNAMRASGAKQGKVNSAMKGLQKLTKQTQVHEKEYQDSVAKLAAYQVEWAGKIGEILKFLQKQEEERIDSLKESLLRFATENEKLAPFLAESVPRMKAEIAKINKTVDINEFITMHGTGQSKPPAPVFEPYSRTGTAQVSAAVTPAAPPGVAARSSAGAPTTSPRSSGPGRVAMPSPLAPMAPAPDRVICVVTAKFDYVGQDSTELDFLAGDRIEVFEKDPSGWFTGRVQGTSHKAIFPSNYVE